MPIQLVGILNITSDSFSDAGLYLSPKNALDHAKKLFSAGASILDVGAESTRPGATSLTPDEEWERLEPVIGQLVNSYPGRISLDTFHPETVARVIKAAGPVIVNDVTGFNNPLMIKMIADNKLRCIVSHLPTKFGQDIQAAHQNPKLIDSTQTVVDDLLKRRNQMILAGIKAEDIILDPGIGFGKTSALNMQLLEFAKFMPGHDVMIGYSKKRFLGENRMNLEVNLEAGKKAIEAGAKYLRVHDVAGHYTLTQN